MSRSSRRTGVRKPMLAVAATLTAGVLVTGCGVSDADLRPGLAASVDGTDITLDDVDAATDAVCSYFSSGAVQEFTPFPRGLQRQTTATVQLQELALRALMDDRGLTLPAEYGSTTANIATEFADLDDDLRDEIIDYATVNTYVGTAASVVGDAAFEDEGSVPGTPDLSQQRGFAEASAWLEEHDLALNPVLGITLTDDGLTPTDDDVSTAVSDRAVAGVLDLDDPAVSEQIAGLVTTLPDDQVCGA